MDELISKHEAYKMLKDKQAAYMQVAVNEAFGTAARMIDQMKPADVQTVKHGRWIADNKDNRGYADCYTCTNCDDYVYTFTLMKDCEFEYCPNCGAKMDGDAE